VGKHPLTARGKDDATDDPPQVLAWWTRWPRANIGIRPAPGLVVLDVDPRHGGDLALTAITTAHDMPATWSAATGGGGWHYWFTMSGPIRSRLRPGIDLKGSNGYVVAPPSRVKSADVVYR
jgi:hypothetical protein